MAMEKYNGHTTSHSHPNSPARGRACSWEKNGKKASKHNSYEREFRVAVIGPKSVGKSAITVRYLTKRFIGDYDEKETFCSKVVMVDNKATKVHILDTNCSTSVMDEYINWADGIILVFSLTDFKSFQEAKELSKTINAVPRENHPVFLLVGNKSDLAHRRNIHTAQARELAGLLNCPYLECSASDSYASVNSAFNVLFKEIVHKRTKRKHNKTSLKLLSLKQTLISLTDFRTRTNTF